MGFPGYGRSARFGGRDGPKLVPQHLLQHGVVAAGAGIVAGGNPDGDDDVVGPLTRGLLANQRARRLLRVGISAKFELQGGESLESFVAKVQQPGTLDNHPIVIERGRELCAAQVRGLLEQGNNGFRVALSRS